MNNNKSIDEYVKEIYKKYEETLANNDIYPIIEMKRPFPIETVCKVFVCLIFGITAWWGVNNFTYAPSDEKIKYEYVSSGIQEDGKNICTKYILVDNDERENRMEQLIAESDNIVIIENIDILDVNFEIIKQKVWLKTERKFKVNKILKGDTIKENIKVQKYGGMMSIVELEKNDEIDWIEWEKETLNYIVPENEKANTYYRQIARKGVEPEIGKQYLVFLQYDEEENIYSIEELVYGIMEYDPATNMVKDIDTGEFVEFDWNLITD